MFKKIVIFIFCALCFPIIAVASDFNKTLRERIDEQIKWSRIEQEAEEERWENNAKKIEAEFNARVEEAVSKKMEQQASEAPPAPDIYRKKGKSREITFTNGSVVRTDSFWEEGGFFAYELYGAVIKVDKTSVKEIK